MIIKQRRADTARRFWSELRENERFQVEYQGRSWTGYKSLLACLWRALDENIPITTPRWWNDRKTSDDVMRHVFRSATDETMPLLDQRIAMLRDAGMELIEVRWQEKVCCSGADPLELW